MPEVQNGLLEIKNESKGQTTDWAWPISVQYDAVLIILVPEEFSPLKGPKRDHFFPEKGTKKGPRKAKKGTISAYCSFTGRAKTSINPIA